MSCSHHLSDLEMLPLMHVLTFIHNLRLRVGAINASGKGLRSWRLHPKVGHGPDSDSNCLSDASTRQKL